MRSKNIIVNVITSLMLQIVTIICGLIIPRLIIQTFGSNVNGLIASITQFLGYIALLEAGVGPVVKSVLYKPIAQRDKSQIESILKSSERFFKKIAYIFIAYILVLVLVFPIMLDGEFDKIYTISLVLIISISSFAEYFFGMTYKLYLQAEQKTYIVSIIQIVAYIVNTILIVILIKLNCSIQLVKLISALVFVMRPVMQKIYVKKKYNIDYSKVKNEYKLEQKWNGLAQHIAAVVHNNTDIVVLTIFSDIKNVSIYTVYLLVVNGVKNIILSFLNGIDASFGDMIAKKENEILRKSFTTYEIVYYTISTIVFACTLILIVPFIRVYTYGISDANYIVPLFAYLMVIGEFIWALRQPYNELVKAAGHFKQTQIGAWVEALLNIIISVILVIKYGLVGVAIGTLVAIVIRTIEFVIYTSKNILKRSIWIAASKIIISVLELIIIVLIANCIHSFEQINYISWILYAIEVTIIAVIVVVSTNYLIYKNERKNLKNILKKYIKK